MIPIVEYQSIVPSALPAFDDVFSKPRKENFVTYLTGLIVSTNCAISYINDIFFAHKDQSALNHFQTGMCGIFRPSRPPSRAYQI